MASADRQRVIAIDRPEKRRTCHATSRDPDIHGGSTLGGADHCSLRSGPRGRARQHGAGRPLIAVGIPGAGAVSQVGTFHPGGPIYDKPALRAFTRTGAVLDPARIFVGSSSNFGAPLARADQPAGAILSIDPRGTVPIVILPVFAAAGGQASALEGRVMLFTANSPAFLNRVYNPNAVTADLAPVANPTAISINNAFGRPWFTSVPSGLSGTGIQSVIDPDGRPLDGAPSKVAGGIFAGALTDRAPQLVPGSMATGAVATTPLGKSPDGGGRARRFHQACHTVFSSSATRPSPRRRRRSCAKGGRRSFFDTLAGVATWPARSHDEEHDKITTATRSGARLAEAGLAAIA